MLKEELGLNRITLDSGRVLMEVHDKDEGVWEYYTVEGGTLVLSFGVGEQARFTPEELADLESQGYFE